MAHAWWEGCADFTGGSSLCPEAVQQVLPCASRSSAACLANCPTVPVPLALEPKGQIQPDLAEGQGAAACWCLTGVISWYT